MHPHMLLIELPLLMHQMLHKSVVLNARLLFQLQWHSSS